MTVSCTTFLFGRPTFIFGRRIWDVNSGRCVKTIVDDDNPPVAAVAFSANGKYLLCANLDDTLRLWCLNTGRCVKAYRGHQARRYCLGGRFWTGASDGNVKIISGSEDGRILAWDLNSRAVIDEHRASDKPIVALAVKDDLVAFADLETPLVKSLKLNSTRPVANVP